MRIASFLPQQQKEASSHRVRSVADVLLCPKKSYQTSLVPSFEVSLVGVAFEQKRQSPQHAQLLVEPILVGLL